MNGSRMILPQIEIPANALPEWEAFPVECQSELIQALAELLLHLPQLQALEEGMSVPRAVAQGVCDEQRQ
jgi:hypothetical protein